MQSTAVSSFSLKSKETERLQADGNILHEFHTTSMVANLVKTKLMTTSKM